MNILLIGGSRFIGPHIIDGLLEHGHNITVFNQGNLQKKYPRGVNYICGDRNEGLSIGGKFDVVIDTCAYNGDHTKRVITELKFDFLVHVSTAGVYLKTGVYPYTENDQIGGLEVMGEYAKGKTESENVLLESGINYSSLRPVYILGPKNHNDRENFIYSHLIYKYPILIPGKGQSIIQFVFVEEVSKSIILLAEGKHAGIFNCGGNQTVTLTGLVEQMAAVVGVRPIIRYNEKADGENYIRTEFPFPNENFFVSNEKIKSLGVAFISLLKGLKRDYNDYYKDNIKR